MSLKQHPWKWEMAVNPNLHYFGCTVSFYANVLNPFFICRWRPLLFDQILQLIQIMEQLLDFSSPCYGHIALVSLVVPNFFLPFFPFRSLCSSQPTTYLQVTPFTNKMELKIQPLTASDMPSDLPQHVWKTSISTFCQFCNSPWHFPFQLSYRPPTLFLFLYVVVPSFCSCICICIVPYLYPCACSSISTSTAFIPWSALSISASSILLFTLSSSPPSTSSQIPSPALPSTFASCSNPSFPIQTSVPSWSSSCNSYSPHPQQHQQQHHHQHQDHNQN